MSIVFETIHGSHLYGLAHDGSDYDLFRVTTSRARRTRHYKAGNEDVAEVGVSLFLERAASGAHQSVEALFSLRKVWGDESFRPFIENLNVTGHEVFAKYERTIKKFAHSDFKRRRHACRLALNLGELRKHGRFNPTLTQPEATLATKLATAYEGEELLKRILGQQ